MKQPAQLEFLGVAAARTFSRSHPGQTRERGRHYPRNVVCPTCFAPFTSKGIATHRVACSRAKATALALLGAAAAPSRP